MLYEYAYQEPMERRSGRVQYRLSLSTAAPHCVLFLRILHISKFILASYLAPTLGLIAEGTRF